MGVPGKLAGLGAMSLAVATRCGARTGLHVYGDGGAPIPCVELDAQAQLPPWG